MRYQETSILIVEDDQETLKVLIKIFSRHFAKIFTAPNGKIALSIVRASNPDLILTDIHMPEVNGIEFVKKIRSSGIQTPVVMISSANSKDDLINAIKLGVLDFVEKPFRTDEIEIAVLRVLEMSIRTNELPNMIFLFGKDSKKVKKQRKLVGLLQAISTNVIR